MSATGARAEGAESPSATRDDPTERAAAPRDDRAEGAERAAVTTELTDAVWRMIGAARRLKARKHEGSDGPGSSDLRVLGHLEALGGPAPIGAVGRVAGLNPASTTALIDRLEHDGLVHRTRDTADRRVVLVALTDRGRDAVAERVAVWRAEWQDDLAALPDEDLVVTARTLTAIAALLDAR